LAKVYQTMKFQEFSIEFQLKSTHRRFSDFLFKIHSESEELSIRKFAPSLITFTTIFYFKCLELKKIHFRWNQVWKKFEKNQIFSISLGPTFLPLQLIVMRHLHRAHVVAGYWTPPPCVYTLTQSLLFALGHGTRKFLPLPPLSHHRARW
jgi:hypothetical protein